MIAILSSVQKLLSPLARSRVLVVEPNKKKRDRLYTQLVSLGATVILASSVAAAIAQKGQADVVVASCLVAKDLPSSWPIILIVEDDGVGLRNLRDGCGRNYILEGSSVRALGKVVVYVQHYPSLTERSDRLFCRAAALTS